MPGFLKLRNREKDQTQSSQRQQADVWGLCRKSKWVRMARRVYCVDQMEQIVHTEEVRREGRKKVKKL